MSKAINLRLARQHNAARAERAARAQAERDRRHRMAISAYHDASHDRPVWRYEDGTPADPTDPRMIAIMERYRR